MIYRKQTQIWCYKKFENYQYFNLLNAGGRSLTFSVTYFNLRNSNGLQARSSEKLCWFLMNNRPGGITVDTYIDGEVPTWQLFTLF